MQKKRGQATAFIILGILVVSSILGVYFARDYILKSSWERGLTKSLTVPAQAESVKSFVDSCILDLSSRGVDLLGQQGGYIVMPSNPMEDPLDKISNTLAIFPGFKTVYWYFKAKNNVEVFQKPSLEDMQNELASYIDYHLRDCLDFSKFTGYKIKTGTVKTNVEIKDDEILLTTKLPVHIELKDFKFDIGEFYTKVTAPLGNLYQEASKIYDRENLDMFLERNTINTLVLSEEIPVTGITRDCGTKIWVRRDVVNAINKYVPLNIQMLKVKGTNYELIDPVKEEYYELDLGVRDSDMDVSFYSSDKWPNEIEIIPSEGELLQAESVTKSAGALEGLAQSFFCMNYYQFLYNLKYPVLVILSKNDYTFKFATQIVIKSNEARKSTSTPLSIPEVDKSFCDNKQVDLDVYTYDDEGDGVSNVNIKFKCINIVCDIGKTIGNYLKAKFPPCLNGAIITSKEDYNSGKLIISTNEPAVASVTMAKVRDIGVEVSITNRVDSRLAEGEKAFVSMTDSENEFSSSLIYPDQKEIKLIPGNYEVYAYILKDTKGITIRGETKEICIDVPEAGIAGLFGATTKKCVNVDIPSTELTNVMVGGAKFNMAVSANDLRKPSMRLYIPYKGMPKSYGELSILDLEVGENFVYPKFE